MSLELRLFQLFEFKSSVLQTSDVNRRSAYTK